MQEIEQGEFFRISTEEREQALRTILQELRKRESWTKSAAVQKLYREQLYKQKQDCKDFVKNLVRSENIMVDSFGRSKIGLKRENVVTNQ